MLYRSAEILFFPSLYEGFGLPPLEAQAYGYPVIVSERASLPEVFDSSVLYCNPESIDDISKSLLTMINDKDLRTQLKHAGLKNCRRFSWRQSAEKIYDFIHE